MELLPREDLLVSQNSAKVVASETDLLVRESQRQREQMHDLLRRLRAAYRLHKELIGEARRASTLLQRRGP